MNVLVATAKNVNGGIWIANSVSQLIYLFQQLLGGYKTRDQAIKKCITLVSENAKQLREKNEKNPDDFQIMKDLRKEQTKVSILCTRSDQENQSLDIYLPCKWNAFFCWTLDQTILAQVPGWLFFILEQDIALLLCLSHHCLLQRPQSFWSAPRIMISGQVQCRKSAILRLPVNPEKSHWLKIWNEYSAHAHKIGRLDP